MPGVLFQMLQIPQSIARRPKKLASHVIADADNFVVFPVKKITTLESMRPLEPVTRTFMGEILGEFSAQGKLP
jgi:hypothetical protein